MNQQERKELIQEYIEQYDFSELNTDQRNEVLVVMTSDEYQDRRAALVGLIDYLADDETVMKLTKPRRVRQWKRIVAAAVVLLFVLAGLVMSLSESTEKTMADADSNNSEEARNEVYRFVNYGKNNSIGNMEQNQLRGISSPTNDQNLSRFSQLMD